MSKTLQVIEPFFTVNAGDHFELTEDGKQYVHTTNESFSSADVEGEDITSEFTSSFSISIPYAKHLVEEGVLSEVTAEPKFVNIFDEIDTLTDRYTNDLKNVWNTNEPTCVKVERETVLQNMIKLLSHLKNLKK